MSTIQVQEFKGLNRRASLEVAPRESLYLGNNVDLTLGRSIVRRDGLRKVCDLDPQTKGLYVAGGLLRVAAPSGAGLPAGVAGAVTVIYDRLSGPPTRYTTGTVTMTNDSTVVTLAGGTWPDDVVGLLLYIPSAGYAATIASRVSGTVLELTSKWTGVTSAGLAFELDGVATPYPANSLIRVTAAEVYGGAEFGSSPYLVVERWRDPLDPNAGTSFEHHYVASTGNGLNRTYVPLPFAPGSSLTKLNNRLWASNQLGDSIHFSSIEFGPTNWSALGDAGFLPVAQHALGRRGVAGLGVYNDSLAVVFSDSVQIWETAIDPQAHRFIRAMNGPGTEAFGTVENVRGDLFYFTRGGFRSLHTQTVTGEIQEMDDIGAPVYELTKPIDGSNGVALWSQARGSYLCAFGTQVFIYRWSPNAKVAEWTTWTFPVAVDGMVELGGNLYIRAENTLYVLDPEYDDGAEFLVQFHFSWGKERHTRKRWDFLEVVQDGTSEIRYAFEPTTPTVYDGDPIRLTGSTTGMDRVPILVMSPMLAVSFRGNKPWRLDSFAVSFTQLAW